jgi:hypothetical protein
MDTSTFCRGKIPSRTDLGGTLNELRRLVEKACLGSEITAQLIEAIEGADRVIAGGNIPLAIDAIDRFVLVVQRHLGSHISLSKAFELVDIAILDFKRFIADPAQVFSEAVAFARRFYDVDLAVDTPVTIVARPLPAGVAETVRSMREVIRSYRVPADAESRLQAHVDQMGELASQFDPAPPDDVVEAAFLAVLAPFKAEIAVLQGRYITATQASRLFGTIVFGVPAWLCAVPKAWIAQAIIVGAGVLIYYFFSDPKAVKTAVGNLNTYINTVTANTNRRPGVNQIQSALRAETAGLSLEELQILKKRLTTALNGVPPGTKKGILNQMLQELERVIDERASGIEPVQDDGNN